MTLKEFKTIAQLLKKAYKELEDQAVKERFDMFSPEYEEMRTKIRETILTNHNFTLDEYREMRHEVEGVSTLTLYETTKQLKEKIDEVDSKHIPTTEEIAQIADEISKKYIVPPQIINKIVKVVEKPKIIKEKEIQIDRELLEDIKRDLFEIQQSHLDLFEKIDKFKIPLPPDLEKLKNEMREEWSTDFGKNLKKNIDMLNMPDFRKLGMGLQSQIDERVTGTSDNLTVPKITVSATEPVNPKPYDIWIDIS